MPRLPTWEDVKRVADEVEKKVQSASVTAREKWNQQVRPKLEEVQKKIEHTGHRAGDAIQHQVSVLGEALSKLQQEIADDLKILKKDAVPTTDAKAAEPKPADAPDEAKPDEKPGA